MAEAMRHEADGANVLFLVEMINCNDGIASYCETLAGGLKRAGAKVFMVTGRVVDDETSAPKRRKLESALEHWYVLPKIGKIPSPAAIRAIRDIIVRHDIKVLNVHGLGMLMVGRLLATLTGVRCFATYHPSILGGISNIRQAVDQDFSLVQKSFLNLFFPDRLIVLSQASVDMLERNVPLHRKKIVKIYGGTDLSHFHPPSEAERAAARTKYGLRPGDFACVLVGRLAWVKGHDITVKAARQLRDESGMPIKCLFVGSGGKEREKEIRDFAHAGGSADEDTFRFLGFMSDVRDVIWASDVCVVPSRFESWALVVIEAMAAGTVVIRTPSGGAADQIEDGVTGFIVPFEDAGALAEAIHRLGDDDFRQAMAARGSARAHDVFGVEPMVEKMLALYGLDPRAAPTFPPPEA